jgi:hypothetical protein
MDITNPKSVLQRSAHVKRATPISKYRLACNFCRCLASLRKNGDRTNQYFYILTAEYSLGRFGHSIEREYHRRIAHSSWSHFNGAFKGRHDAKSARKGLRHFHTGKRSAKKIGRLMLFLHVNRLIQNDGCLHPQSSDRPEERNQNVYSRWNCSYSTMRR